MLSGERWDTIYDLAEQQHGHFTTQQAETLGFARSTLHHHQQQGRIRRVLWGVYRLRNYPISPQEREAALTLWSADRDGAPQAVISHETALAHYELSDVLPSKIHLTVPRGFRKRPPDDVVLHKNDLKQGDIRSEGLLRYTTPIRTLLDLFEEHFSSGLLAQALAEGMERGLIRMKELGILEEKAGLSGPRGVLIDQLLQVAGARTQ